MSRVRIAVFLAVVGALIWVGLADQVAESSGNRIVQDRLAASVDATGTTPYEPAEAAQPELSARARELADPELARFTNQDCPTTGSTTEAFFDPQPHEQSLVLDVDPGADWQGYELVRVADIVLADGVMLESNGTALGADGQPVRIADPGTYPFFMALSRYPDRTVPALGQLVFDTNATPVRWVDDDRLGFVTDSGTGWIGSPDIALPAPANASAIDLETWSLVSSALAQFPADEFCVTWEREDGTNFVHYRNGGGEGVFPGAAGYDEAGNLIAITWFYGTGPWVLAGIPGTPPVQVQQQYAAN